MRSTKFAKRSLDVTVAVLGLVLLSPLLAGIALAAGLVQGRPIIFTQQRAGLDGQPFTLRKFRTMRPPRVGENALGPTQADRVTRLGRFLRSTSLDELPELWNVLKGEMSIVGPRPLLMEYLDGYTAREARRHEVRPGITGWAAVNGRHTTRFEERLRMDAWYVDNWSILLDLRIIGLTAMQVVTLHDVSTTQTADVIQVPDRFLQRVGHSSLEAADGRELP